VKTYNHIRSINKILQKLVIAAFFMGAIPTYAQTEEPNTHNLSSSDLQETGEALIRLNLNKELKDQLLPIDSLIEIAARNNPSIKAQEALMNAGEDQIRFARREWQNGISGFFTQSMGNQTLFFDSNQEPAGVQSQSLVTGYRFGLNVNIPLFWFSARTSRINVFKNELDVRAKTRDKLKLDLARQVVYEYNNVLSTHRILLIASSARGNARMLLDMADKQFAQGDMTIADYSSVFAIATKTESDYEIAKRDFYSWYQQLEKLIGVRLDTLIRKP
jgi:outer membrane protein TolC